MGWKPDRVGYYRNLMHETDWNPAERIEHAWMVVEKFDYYEIWKLGNGNYLVRLFTAPLSDGDWSWTKGEADTAPLAISLAALASCGVKDE